MPAAEARPGVVTFTTEDVLRNVRREKPGEAIQLSGWGGVAAFSTNHFLNPDRELHWKINQAQRHTELGELVDRIPFTVDPHISWEHSVEGYLDVYRFKPTAENRRLPREYPNIRAPRLPFVIRAAFTNLAHQEASLRPEHGGILFVVKNGDKQYAAHIGTVIGNGDNMSAASDGWIRSNSREHVEVVFHHTDLPNNKYIIAGLTTTPIAGGI